MLFNLISNASEMTPFGTCACNRAFLNVNFEFLKTKIAECKPFSADVSKLQISDNRSEGWGRNFGVNKPKMRNIIIWNIGKIFVPLFSPFWTWVHIRSKKFFNKGQGFFVIVRMNKKIHHCILRISLFMGHKMHHTYKFGHKDDFGCRG